MSKPSKAAERVAKRIGKVAKAGTLTVENPGQYHERVWAVIGSDEIRVSIQNGRVLSHHTQPVGSVSRPEEDYFPGTYWSSLATAISTCLPEERASVQNPADLTGWLTVTVRRAGVALKPEACVELSFEHTYQRHVVRKVKGGTLLALCQEVAKSKDAAAVAALLDHLEETNPQGAGEYIQAARRWPEVQARMLQDAKERAAARNGVGKTSGGSRGMPW